MTVRSIRKRRRLEGANLSEAIFDAGIYIIVTLAVFICLAPFVYIIALSLSSVRAINSREVYLWPVELDWLNYIKVVNDPTMLSSLWNSVFVTVTHTGLAMVMTILCAYPLTKTRLRGRRIITTLIIFTMMFSGGLIPDYLLIKNLKLTNSLLSLILPGCLATMNMMITATVNRITNTEGMSILGAEGLRRATVSEATPTISENTPNTSATESRLSIHDNTKPSSKIWAAARNAANKYCRVTPSLSAVASIAATITNPAASARCPKLRRPLRPSSSR